MVCPSYVVAPVLVSLEVRPLRRWKVKLVRADCNNRTGRSRVESRQKKPWGCSILLSLEMMSDCQLVSEQSWQTRIFEY